MTIIKFNFPDDVRLCIYDDYNNDKELIEYIKTRFNVFRCNFLHNGTYKVFLECKYKKLYGGFTALGVYNNNKLEYSLDVIGYVNKPL